MSSIKYRHLSRDSAHRRALLRNLVTALVEHESIATTYAKAKEAQRLAEKLITMGKKNTNASRQNAESILFEPHKHLPKVFGELRERYTNRSGGYTRLLRSEPLKEDQAPSAILSLVDGPKDLRFAMTAKTLAREREQGVPMRPLTAVNVRKVTRFRENGEAELEKEVERLEAERRKVEARERKNFEEKGERVQWIRQRAGKHAGGPGRMRKEKVKADPYV